MAGYSGTPLTKKLGIKEGHTVALLGAPSGFERTLEELPDGVRFVHAVTRKGTVDVVLLLAKSRAYLQKSVKKAADALTPAGGLWIAWPKKASGVATDVTERVVHEVGLSTGLVDNKVCAINDVWSGFRFVYRLENRPKNAAIRAKR